MSRLCPRQTQPSAGLAHLRTAAVLLSFSSVTRCLGFFYAGGAKRRPRAADLPPPLGHTDPHLLAKDVALDRAAVQAQPSQLHMLKADVGVGKKIRFAIGGPQQLLRRSAGCDQARDHGGLLPGSPAEG